MRYASAFILSMFCGAMLVLLIGCFSLGSPRIPEGLTGPQGPMTPFARDMRTICIPISFLCIIGGLVGIIASRWLLGLSAKTCGLVVACGFGLLFSMHFLIRYEWVVNILAWVCMGSLALALAHWLFNKLVGAEGASPIKLLPPFMQRWFHKPAVPEEPPSERPTV